MAVPLHPLIESALLGLVTTLRARKPAEDIEVQTDTVRAAIRCVYRDFIPAQRPPE